MKKGPLKACGISWGLNIPKVGISMPIMGIKEKSAVHVVRPGTSLADALFSTVQQRVLAYLFGQPDRSFFATQLIKLTGGGSGAVQRELARLEDSGLATATRIGTQKHYQANPQSPIFREMCAIVQKTVGLAEPLRAALRPLAKRIFFAFVYGSVARKQDTAQSDIDLMVVGTKVTYADLFGALAEVSERLGRQVNPTVYSPQELAKVAKEESAFVKRVLAQPKIWLIGDESDLTA
ncbi:MAG TPA: nucleotidyltransferase domain-containing protein [Burkholderiales bacterium]|nr:nucleotidyltransferase domain-containing protein [Burkholderiales bacterium]